MSIRFTGKVREILNHIETNGFITNKQCAMIYYKDNKQPYIQAQTKMKLLYDNKVVKRYENKINGEYIYTIKGERISEHKLYIMNLYAYLYHKFDIIYFKLEECWNCKRKNDAHIIVQTKSGDTVGLLCEIDFFHKTSKEKLDSIYRSNEVQAWYQEHYGVQDYYPSVLIINHNGKIGYSSDSYEILTTDFEMANLSALLGG